ncbi:type IV pilin [Halorubrum sp. CSM-61]|uniref:type IV pilin n=1 Tax=Halorubrum sp. CSM-61 TaxID=2485838 RepID=UPI000F4CAD7A|nr:type IV pilin [Halorubrum sp. CSM-61]
MGSIRQFGEADRGVSPVIGVVLMIAITVVISAAAGTLVLQIVGDQTAEMGDEGVDAEFSVAFNGDSVEVTHTGGDAVPAEELLIDGDVRRSQRWGEYGDVSPGDSVTVDAVGANRTIVVVHSGPYGDEEVLLRAEE